MRNKKTISAVVNTFNEEKNIYDCLNSLRWADEIVVVDMHSEDRTVEICRQFTDKIYFYERTGYVEPARNFGIDKANSDYILIVDADERIPNDLAKKLREIVELPDPPDYLDIKINYYMFGKLIKYTSWNPHYAVRFFKKGFVAWNDEIHSTPTVKGKGLKLEAGRSLNLAITHFNYNSISQFIEKSNRYTDIEAKNLINKGYNFSYLGLVNETTNRFIDSFFIKKGYRDGLYGLILSFLLSFYMLLKYSKVCEIRQWRDNTVSRGLGIKLFTSLFISILFLPFKILWRLLIDYLNHINKELLRNLRRSKIGLFLRVIKHKMRNEQ